MSEALAASLKATARRLGFDLVGISTAEPITESGRLLAWVAAGCHGGMSFMARTAAQRGDPGTFLPHAASVLCVAMAYNDSPDPLLTESPQARLRIARYATRPDYHQVVRARLRLLARELSSRVPSASWRIAVDGAALAEKELAERAGLGWIGANTLLINADLGSQLLLGELVTDVELPPDPPAANQCGDCSACLEVCPTRALAAPRCLDARRCIAYLTIEHRGAWPADLAGLVGDHFFGCDLCQLACPWNQRAQRRCDSRLRSRPDLMKLTLETALHLDTASWRRLVAGTPLARLDAPRLARNLAAVHAARRP